LILKIFKNISIMAFYNLLLAQQNTSNFSFSPSMKKNLPSCEMEGNICNGVKQLHITQVEELPNTTGHMGA
jgi:hypothetical protein